MKTHSRISSSTKLILVFVFLKKAKIVPIMLNFDIAKNTSLKVCVSMFSINLYQVKKSDYLSASYIIYYIYSLFN